MRFTLGYDAKLLQLAFILSPGANLFTSVFSVGLSWGISENKSSNIINIVLNEMLIFMFLMKQKFKIIKKNSQWYLDIKLMIYLKKISSSVWSFLGGDGKSSPTVESRNTAKYLIWCTSELHISALLEIIMKNIRPCFEPGTNKLEALRLLAYSHTGYLSWCASKFYISRRVTHNLAKNENTISSRSKLSEAT